MIMRRKWIMFSALKLFSFFINVEDSIIWKIQSELRAPIKLTEKTSIQKLRNQTKETIASLTEQGPYTIFDFKEFCTLRDALVYNLTLCNARTDGGASSMTLVGRMTRCLWSASESMFIVFNSWISWRCFYSIIF